MKIGEISLESGIASKTIRYYESVGLLPAPPREENGYRDYDTSHLESLKFVHRARTLGFSLKDISKLLDLWQDSDRTSADVKRLTQRHIDDIEKRINELESMRSTLIHLANSCSGDDRPDCPILADLAARS